MRVILVLWGFLFVSGFLGAQEDELTITLGHTSSITSVAFSPDGQYILTGSDDHTAKLWERDSGREIKTFKEHAETVTSVAFSPEGRYILTGSKDSTAKLWDTKLKRIKTFKEHADAVFSVAFSPDGKYILTGSDDHTAKLWDLEANEIKTFKGHADGVSSVAFSPDGKYILTGSYDHTAKLWDLEAKEIKTFEGHASWISSLAFSPEGRYILTGSYDHTAKLWDLEANEIKTFKGHVNVVYSVAFSPEGRYILTGSKDMTAKLWDSKAKEIKTFMGHAGAIYSVAFSPDGKYILTGSGDMTAKLWSLKAKEIKTFTRHASFVLSGVVSPDRKYILTGSVNNTAIWDLKSNEVKTFEGYEIPIFSVALSPDGKYFLTGSRGDEAMLWDLEAKEIKTLKGHAKSVYSVAFSPDGRYILTGSEDNTARLWDLEANEIRTFKGHVDAISSVAFSPEGRYILTGSFDQTAKLWDLKANEIRTFKGHAKSVISVAFSPDGRYILTGSKDNTAKLWDLEAKEIKTFKGHADVVYSVTFSPDGRYILTGSIDHTAKLWDLEANEIETFEEHTSSVFSVAFSPDGKYFLTASFDGTVKIWSIVTLDLLCTIVSFDNEGWVVITPEGKYDGNKEGLKFLYVPNNVEDTSRKFSQVDGLLRKVIIENPAISFALGTRAFEEEQFAEAEEIFSEAIKQGYELSESYFLRAKTRVKRKLYREAIKDLDLLLALEPSNKEAIRLRKEAIGSLENIQLIGGKPTFEILTNLPTSINSDYFRCQVLVKSQTPISLTMFLLNERRVKTIADSQVVDGVILTADLALKEGKNEFYVLAVNGKGKQESKTSEIYFRTEADQFKFRKNYALLFALDSYSHDPPWPSLNNPAYDSKALKDLLEKKYGFEVELIENPDAISIQQSLLKFSEIDYQKYDQLWVFYSGHGTNDLIAKNKGKFVPIDSRNKFEGYSHGDFLNQLDAIKCPHIFLVADACYSGFLSQYDPGRKSDDDLKPKRGSWFYREKSDDEFVQAELGKVSRRFLASGAEVVPDGVPNQHSPFMDRLLQTLEKGGGKDNILEFAEIVAGVKKLKVSTPVYGRFGSDEPESNFLLVEKK